MSLPVWRDHDTVRNRAQKNEKPARKTLTRNGKYFVAPQKTDEDFKQLFARLASAGAGKRVDPHGFPDGPWTPETLADAISSIEVNSNGIELRTVQVWFQDNDNGISNENLRWLARIFGCDDPKAASEWQTELSAARSKLDAKRRKKRGAKETTATRAPDLDMSSPVCESKPENELSLATKPDAAAQPTQRSWLVQATEAVFSRSPLNLPASVFAGAVALQFTSYFLGIHEVTFEAPDGLTKQVGFLWAPNWTFLFLAFMPIFFAATAELLSFWKETGRPKVANEVSLFENHRDWSRNLDASSYTFWAVFLICLLFAGVFQWISVRLLPLLRGGGDFAIDWGSLAIVSPEIISVPEAMAFTGFAYLYMCISFYLFFAALILLYCVAQDFGNIRSNDPGNRDAVNDDVIRVIGARVMRAIFRCVVLAILIAVCMKLQSAYLTSSGKNILRWLMIDMRAVFSSGDRPQSLGNYSAPNHFTSLLIVLSSIFVFLHGASRVTGGVRANNRFGMMVVTIGLLSTAYLLIGAFAGFSVLLLAAVLLATYALCDPDFGQKSTNEKRRS
ncbi:hypothetical protein [uncultured Tateyamaria sp.]|uniref:RcgA family putative transporter n=1 Tax=uncultured Tateyamaria sp. TaxID=455651 RepID=UPI00261A3FD9|nr:hypothetical protein [uncultured Tateyamaria sp.]